MKFGKKSMLFLFFIINLSFSFLVAANEQNEYNQECFPSYECGEWSKCIDGLNSRTCQDKKCGMREIIERKICETEIGCRPRIKCKEWSQCDYSEKIEDLLHGKISFGGFKERTCVDEAGCAESFLDEEPCKEEYQLELKKKAVCGREYLSATDSLSNREIARIDIESWEAHKLNIVLIEGKVEYCPSCSNGIKDNDERDIDCGGNCAPCKEKKIISIDKIIQIGIWAIAAVFLAIMAYEILAARNHGKKEVNI